MTRDSGRDALTLPAPLAKGIRAAADADDRQPTELGLTETNRPRLIAEARREPGRMR